ncbi:MAG: hypothetical protein LBV63_05035 [Candidatus Methanoplasma sp.]|jgi:hypothetical protein|nr:hypothetical protein [Candidatus Methanoplasma sp.]
MAEKKRLRMRGVKQTPKRLEEAVLERSRTIAEDPGILRPMCAGNCRKCLFDKPFKNIDSIARYKDNADTLLKLASKGSDDLGKAYAGTISLNAAGKIPMLATASIAGEKVSYAVRGAVGVDKLIGCQYYNDPKLRLLYYNAFIKKNKLHLYSFENGLVCSDSPNMPDDYLYESFWESPYEFKDDGLDCGHEGALRLDIHIKSAKVHVKICEDCAKEVSTIQYLLSRICAADPLDDFDVKVIHSYHSAGESDTVKIDGDTLHKYLRGEINDRALLQSVKKDKLGSLKAGTIATYLVGSNNYGSDLEAFVKAVTGPDEEKSTVKKFLEAHPTSLVIKNGKTSEILMALWDDHWRDLVAIHTSQKVADSYGEKPKTIPSQVLSDAYHVFISADVVASLPEFKRAGPLTKLADAFAKAAKVGGVDLVKKKMETETLKDRKARSLSAAFVLACDKNAGLPVTLTAEERGFTDFLVPFVKQVIDAGGEKYRENMNTLLTALGSGESV